MRHFEVTHDRKRGTYHLLSKHVYKLIICFFSVFSKAINGLVKRPKMTNNSSLVDVVLSDNPSSPEMALGWVLVAAVMEVMICIVGTVGNLLTIVAILRNKSLQYAANLFIVSLSVADLLVCSVLVPMRASQHVNLFNGRNQIPRAVVEIAGFIGRVNIIASISCLAALSIDRCVALSCPVRYLTSVRFATKKILVAIAVIWAVAIFMTSVPKFPGVSDKPFIIFFVTFVLCITVVILVAYYKIFKIAMFVQRRMAGKALSNVVRLSVSASMDPRAKSIADTKPDAQETPAQRQERKAAKTIAFVIGAFILLVYPRIIMLLYHMANKETPSSRLARFWVRVLLYSNSAVNPAVYAWRHKEIRREFKKILKKCWHRLACKDKHQIDVTKSRSGSKGTLSTTLETTEGQGRKGGKCWHMGLFDKKKSKTGEEYEKNRV